MTPEALTRQHIDPKLVQAGWLLQDCWRRHCFDQVCRKSMTSLEAEIPVSMRVLGYRPWSVKIGSGDQIGVGANSLVKLHRAVTGTFGAAVFASHLQYTYPMKTATLPPIRVAPDFRLELEGVLEQGETLSQFVENAVRATVAKRKNQAEFVRRGMAAIEETKRNSSGISADVVVAKLEAKLAAAKQLKAQRGG